MSQNVFQIAAYSGIDGAIIYDWSATASNLSFSRNTHGASTMRVNVAMNERAAYSLYDGLKTYRVEVSDGPIVVWAGRLEDVRIVSSGVEIGAYGAWRALSDNEYTALWSVTKVEKWETVTTAQVSNRVPYRYEIRTEDDSLIIIPKKGLAFFTGADVGDAGYYIPSLSERAIRSVTFDYTVNLPLNWIAALEAYNTGFLSGATVWSVTGTGAAVSGSASVTLTRDRIDFIVYNNSGTNVTSFADETGNRYMKISNLRIKTTTSATVYADEIANAIAAYSSSVNPTQLSASTARIQSPALDLKDVLFEDRTPADILDELAGYGDNQTPPRVWHAGVTDNQEVYFQPFGYNARTWYVDLSETLEIEQTIDNLVNRTRALYKDTSNRVIRTVYTNDAVSQSRYGLIRDRSVSADTTASAVAIKQRDLALADGATPKPRTGLRVDRVYDGSGSPWPATVLDIGDTVVIRNFGPIFVQDIDRLASFKLAEIEISDNGTAQLTPEEAIPQLDSYLAAQSRPV